MQVVADAPNSRRELWEERCWSEFRDGARIRGTSYRDPLDFRTETVRVEMIVDIAAPGVSIRISATETHRLLLPQSLAYIASSAGHMLLKEVYADFDLATPYLGSRRSPRMICVFTKEHSPPRVGSVAGEGASSSAFPSIREAPGRRYPLCYTARRRCS